MSLKAKLICSRYINPDTVMWRTGPEALSVGRAPGRPVAELWPPLAASVADDGSRIAAPEGGTHLRPGRQLDDLGPLAFRKHLLEGWLDDAAEEPGRPFVDDKILEQRHRTGQSTEELDIVRAGALVPALDGFGHVGDGRRVSPKDLPELAVVIIDQTLATLGAEFVQAATFGCGGIQQLVALGDDPTVPASPRNNPEHGPGCISWRC